MTHLTGEGAVLGDGSNLHPASNATGYFDITHFLPKMGYVVQRECSPSWAITDPRTTFTDVTFVLRGRARYEINGEQIDVGAGDLLYVPTGSRRFATTSARDPMSCFSINFWLTDRDGAPHELDLPPVLRLGLRADVVELFRELWFAWTHKQHGYATRVNGIMLLLLDKALEAAARPASAPDPRITDATRHVVEHFREPLDIAGLAGRYGLSPVYFADLFRRQNGVSPRQYLTRVRIQHAQELLGTGEYTVGEVAERCGYPDVLYFRRHFREVTGLRPSAFGGRR